jgi:hypothetical protein
MGTWGPGIFSDDTARDIRAGWRDALMEGLSAQQATKRLMESYRDVLKDRDEAPVFWLALAAAQHQTGRLLPDVRDRALALIDNGGDVARFAEEDAVLGRKREEALRRLAAKLRGPQRSPTGCRRPKPRISPLTKGDVIKIRGSDERSEGLFVVVDHADTYPPGSRDAVVAGLLWTGGAVPSPDEMARLPLLVEEPILRKPNRPVVSLYVVHHAVRGKIALSNFGEVVAHGVNRPDAPDHRKWDKPGGPRIGYGSWLYLANWLGTEAFHRSVQLTIERQR